MSDLHPDPTPNIPDGWDFRAGGGAILHIDGKRWNLRRPKLGEFRELRTRFNDAADEIRSRSLQLTDEATRLTEAKDPGANDFQVRAGREVSLLWENARVTWLRGVFEMLSDHKLPDDDAEWATWLASDDSVAELIKHWQTAPPPRGVRS